MSNTVLDAGNLSKALSAYRERENKLKISAPHPLKATYRFTHLSEKSISVNRNLIGAGYKEKKIWEIAVYKC
jgi:hypothetical protein